MGFTPFFVATFTDFAIFGLALFTVGFRDHGLSRGGYLHPRAQCLELFVKAKVNRFNSLRRGVDRSARVNLVNLLAGRLAPNAEL